MPRTNITKQDLFGLAQRAPRELKEKLDEHDAALDDLEADVAANLTGMAKKTVTVGHADLTVSVDDTPQAIDIGTDLPANAVVLAHEFILTTPFTGTDNASTLVDVGGTDPDAIVDALEVVNAATEAERQAAVGIHPQGSFSAQQLTVTFTPGTAQKLSDLNAGSLTVTVWYLVLA